MKLVSKLALGAVIGVSLLGGAGAAFTAAPSAPATHAGVVCYPTAIEYGCNGS